MKQFIKFRTSVQFDKLMECQSTCKLKEIHQKKILRICQEPLFTDRSEDYKNKIKKPENRSYITPSKNLIYDNDTMKLLNIYKISI